jgi:hypothetical protein
VKLPCEDREYESGVSAFPVSCATILTYSENSRTSFSCRLRQSRV